MFPLQCRWNVGELLELSQGCQRPVQGSGGKLGFLSISLSGKGPQLALRGESPGSSLIAVGFLLSYNGDLSYQLVTPLGGPVSTRVERVPSGFICGRCRGCGPQLELRPESECSSPGPTRTSGFLWRVHRRVSPHLVWSHASPLSS